MANLKREGLNNQKRSVSVAVFHLTESDIIANALVASLPVGSLVTAAKVIPTVVSGTALSNIAVKAGATTIITAVVATATVKTATTHVNLPTGGDITVVVGATPPATGSLECTVVVEYIELNKTTREYTD